MHLSQQYHLLWSLCAIGYTSMLIEIQNIICYVSYILIVNDAKFICYWKNTGLIIKYKKLKFKIYYILRFFLSIKMYNAF